MRPTFADFGITLPAGACGEVKTTCPECSHTRKKRNYPCLNVNTDKGIWHCWHCGWSGGLDPGAAARPLHPSATKPQEQCGFTDYAARIWAETVPITAGCIAGRYLTGRRCALPPQDSKLRWHPALKHFESGRTFPARVGLVTHAEDSRKRLGLHRTYLAAGGSGKADVRDAKMSLCSPLKGGCIRLWPDQWVTTGLALAEGVETALSLALAFRPVWACIDAGHLEGFPVLGGIESLTIAVDNDDAGQKAAKDCTARWRDAGREVCWVVSQLEGADFNDAVSADG